MKKIYKKCTQPEKAQHYYTLPRLTKKPFRGKINGQL